MANTLVSPAARSRRRVWTRSGALVAGVLWLVGGSSHVPMVLAESQTGTSAAGAAGGQAPGGRENGAGPSVRDHELTRQADERLRVLHQEADRLAGEARTLLGQLRKLEIARQIAVEELHQAEAAASTASQELDGLTERVSHLERLRDQERPRLRARFAELYKLGRGRYTRLLLSARDVRQFGQTVRTVAAVAARDQARVRDYEARLDTLNASRTEVGTRQQALDQRRQVAARAQAAAASAIAAQTSLVRDIDQRRDLNAQLVGEMQAVQQKLETTLTTSGATALIALPMGPFRGSLPWPASGAAQRSNRSVASVGRPGIEILAAEGTPVRAIHDGTVVYAGSFDGLGNLVIVDHGDQTFTLYGHLLELAVARGVTVAAREEVGRVGTSTVGHPLLYFELRVNGKAVDPRSWLEPAR